MPKVSYLNTTHMAGNYEDKTRFLKNKRNGFYYKNDNFKLFKDLDF